jgi:hypothetical protein
MTPRKTLNELLAENDELGLLNVKPLVVNSTTEADRIKQQFEEINVFVDRHGYAPGEEPDGQKALVTERQLQMRLKAYQASNEIAAASSNRPSWTSGGKHTGRA